jgi:hypothetical protein
MQSHGEIEIRPCPQNSLDIADNPVVISFADYDDPFECHSQNGKSRPAESENRPDLEYLVRV